MHSEYVASPPQPVAKLQALRAHHASALQDIHVGDPILSVQLEYFFQTLHVETIYSSEVSPVQCEGRSSRLPCRQRPLWLFVDYDW